MTSLSRLSVPLRVVLALLLTGLGALAGYLGWQWYVDIPTSYANSYVGSQTCASCHQVEFDHWKGSHHDLAMAKPTSKTVLGDFNDVSLILDQHNVRFFKKDDQFCVEAPGPDGKPHVYPIKYTFGIDPLQQYLVEFDDGRKQVLPYCWDVKNKKWYHLYDGFHFEPDEFLYWTNGGMNWNLMCADCHSTNLQKNYDWNSNTYKTSYSEINVSCESCHGPGKKHVEIQNRGLGASLKHGTGLVNLKAKSNVPQVETCSKCHARKVDFHPGFKPGQKFLDHYLPELLQSEAYYEDGQIRDEDYVHGSFHLSLMYHKNVKCTNCHDPHTTKVKFQDNRLCTQCHKAGIYDAPSHHHHKVNSKGALCVECHMPQTTYMKTDPRRDHSFRIPRPDLTLALNIPNACNRCHQDKDAKWSDDAVKKWGQNKYKGKQDWPLRIDFAKTIAMGRQGNPAAVTPLRTLARSDNIPAYVKASAVLLLGQFPQGNTHYFYTAMDDSHPLIRMAGVRSLGATMVPDDLDMQNPNAWPAFMEQHKQSLAKLYQLLSDESRLVRIEAAQRLSVLPEDQIPNEHQKAYQAARKEWLDGVKAQLDWPSANLTLADYYSRQRQYQEAEPYYQRALKLDPGNIDSYLHLAEIQLRQQKVADAKATLEKGLARVEKDLKRNKDRPEEYPGAQERLMQQYDTLANRVASSLGRVEADFLNDLPAAQKMYEKAAQFQPYLAQPWYHLAVIAKRQKKMDQAEKYLEKALKQQPGHIPSALSLTDLYMKSEEWNKAVGLTLFLLSNPNTPPDIEHLAMQMVKRFLQQGQIAPARKLLQAIVQSNPLHSQANQILSQLPKN